jgi:hypothetical protein
MLPSTTLDDLLLLLALLFEILQFITLWVVYQKDRYCLKWLLRTVGKVWWRSMGCAWKLRTWSQEDDDGNWRQQSSIGIHWQLSGIIIYESTSTYHMGSAKMKRVIHYSNAVIMIWQKLHTYWCRSKSAPRDHSYFLIAN